MHDSKIAIVDAPHQAWCEGCLVISEANARTIWVFEVDQLKSPTMKTSASIANEAINRMLEQS